MSKIKIFACTACGLEGPEREPCPRCHPEEANKRTVELLEQVPKPLVGKSCTWSSDGGTYETSCRNYFLINDEDTPTDCKMIFCCFCGKPLIDDSQRDDV